MSDAAIQLRLYESLHDIAAHNWDACAGASDPFVSHRFLLALEDSGSVGPGTGWQPHYMTAHLGDLLIGVAPMFAKNHSQGEYVFDMSWADAWQRAGGQYYPKLQIAVPFTPVPGRRLLARPGYENVARAALLEGALKVSTDNGLSSLHVTFCNPDEVATGTAMGFLHRVGQQFHWVNRGYDSFDAFLADLSSRKRKTIRRERRIAQDFGGEIVTLSGTDINADHMEAFWQFYQDTGARKWGTPYLTRQFFDLARDRLADDMVLIMARRDGCWVAGALNFIGSEALYGRYWGAVEDHSCLHFELCYYQAIDAAIQRGLGRVEAGAQGEHKLARGYLPVETHSLHWIADPGFRKAVAEFVDAEAAAVGEDIEILTSMGPFRRSGD